MSEIQAGLENPFTALTSFRSEVKLRSGPFELLHNCRNPFRGPFICLQIPAACSALTADPITRVSALSSTTSSE